MNLGDFKNIICYTKIEAVLLRRTALRETIS